MSSAAPNETVKPKALSSLPGFFQRFLAESSLLREALGKYRRPVALGLLALVIVDILEIFPPIILKKSVDVVVEGLPVARVGWLAALYLVIALLQSICRYTWRMCLVRSSFFGGRDLRNRFTRHLYGLSASFFDRRRIGDLMSLATSDVEAVQTAIGQGLLIFADAIFYFLTIPVAMFLLSPKLTLLALIPLPFIPWWVIRNQREIHRRFDRVQETYGEISSLTQEGLTGIRVLKAFAKEDAQLDRFGKLGEKYLTYNLHLARIQAVFAPMLDLMMSMSLVLLIYLGGRSLIGATGAITLGTFVAFHRFIQKMVWPMTALGLSVNLYRRSVTSSGRLNETFAVSADVPEIPQPVAPRAIRGAVEFSDLSFRFPGTDREILRRVSLKIEAGERVAFIGEVGSGKSAILSLIPRLYPIARGMIRIDGVDLNDWPLVLLREQIGYVSQDVYLFSETVMENIAFGLQRWSKEDRELNAVLQASQMASVHEDVLGLVGAYETQIGERGVTLSGGQKQRLTIARALVKQPAILVLDDALSSVDVQTEERILTALRQRAGRNTELIAAHRISTIRDADRIVALQGGEIAQMGTHAELLRDRSGIYSRFYMQQQLKEDLEQYAQRLEESPHGGA